MHAHMHDLMHLLPLFCIVECSIKRNKRGNEKRKAYDHHHQRRGDLDKKEEDF